MITDEVWDGRGCVEAARGLWGLVGKGGAWDVPGLGPRELSPPTGNPEAYISRGSLGQSSRGHRCGGGLHIYIYKIFVVAYIYMCIYVYIYMQQQKFEKDHSFEREKWGREHRLGWREMIYLILI